MDELIGFFLMAMAVVLTVGAALAAAAAVVVASAVGGGVVVAIIGVGVFLRSVVSRVSTRGGANRLPSSVEPAFELYVLGQFRRDVSAAVSDGIGAMDALRVRANAYLGSTDGLMMPIGIGVSIGAHVGVAVGAVIAGILALPVLAVVLVVIVAAWVIVALLRGAEALRRVVRRTSYECPTDHRRFSLPVYVCPACGAEHRALVPGRFGVLRRECRCGLTALPTMVLNGRQRIPQRCPDGHAMDALVGFAEMIRIAVVAGPSAGKTAFVAGALTEFDRLSRSRNIALSVLDESRSAFDEAVRSIAAGAQPRKTQGALPAMVTEVQGSGRSRVMSLYDAAGESFIGSDQIREIRFFEVPNGILLLIDPSALARVRTDRHDQIDAVKDDLLPSSVDPQRVVENLLNALAATGTSPRSLSVAVVLSKSDALGVGAEVAALSSAHGARAVPTWLQNQGASNLVNVIESSFGSVGWFHASAFGRMPGRGGGSYSPQGTAEPLLWLLERNGVTPAARPFQAARKGQALAGATATDFPPISTGGWAWRLTIGLGGVATIVALIASSIVWGVQQTVEALEGPGPVRCWDGERVDATFECSQPTGHEGLVWLYPNVEPDYAGCSWTDSNPQQVTHLECMYRGVRYIFVEWKNAAHGLGAYEAAYGIAPVQRVDGTVQWLREGTARRKPQATLMYVGTRWGLTVEARTTTRLMRAVAEINLRPPSKLSGEPV